MADSGIWTATFVFLTPVCAHTFVLIKVLRALQWNLLVMGNFTTMKKTPTTELDIFPRKSFSTENEKKIQNLQNPETTEEYWG